MQIRPFGTWELPSEQLCLLVKKSSSGSFRPSNGLEPEIWGQEWNASIAEKALLEAVKNEQRSGF